MNTNPINGWEIHGTDQIADLLRQAAGFISTDVPITICTDQDHDSPDAFALGPAVLHSSTERVVPFFSAFEAVEATRTAVDSGTAGKLYGCFTSVRIPRGSSADQVKLNGLLPALAMTLDTIPGAVQRVWARRASLYAQDDAWFATIRLEDETLLTVEAIAMLQPPTEREILLEVTASDQVLRAEPTRQAIVIESLGSAPRVAPWWENLAERYLQLVATRAQQSHWVAGSRLRAVWNATMQSATAGEPITLGSAR
jgi:hypothetical protein